MRILWLYNYAGGYNFDHWFHMDWVAHLRKAKHACFAYGPRLEEKYKSATILTYNPSVTMQDIHNLFPFDVVIMSTKSRMFNNYRPPLVPPAAEERRDGPWLPSDFNSWKCPKVVLEEDYHYETNNDWYKEVGVNLVLQRHVSSVQRFKNNGDQGIKCFWLPLSVDAEVFKPDGRPRIKQVCVAASVVHEIYKWRKMVIDHLAPVGLLANHAEQRKVENAYVTCLQEYISHANCSSIYDITPAKMFEILASGSVLFTDNTDKYGLKELFPEGSYVTYERDGSNIISQARRIVTEPEWVKTIVAKGRKCIEERHTHAIRIKEMEEIFEREL